MGWRPGVAVVVAIEERKEEARLEVKDDLMSGPHWQREREG